MAYADPAVQRRKDRERFARRTAARIAAGLCPRCGDRPPAPWRSVCRSVRRKVQSCVPRPRRPAARRGKAAARSLPGEGIRTRARQPRDGEARRRGELYRCGKHPAAPGRKSCEPCLEKRRAADRARYAAGKAAGLPYGGADPETKRRAGRAKSKRRQQERVEAGLCIRCGKHPPADGGTTCQPCRDKRQAAERRQYEERRAAGCCTRCGGPAHDGLTPCAPCSAIEQASRRPDRKNARSRKLYAIRRARGLCTACGAPAQGTSRCPPCAEKSWHGSAWFRGIPVWDPTWTVIELETAPRARAVRQSGRRGALPRLREARPQPRRGAVRRARHRLAHRLVLNPAAQPARRPPVRTAVRLPGLRQPREAVPLGLPGSARRSGRRGWSPGDR